MLKLRNITAKTLSQCDQWDKTAKNEVKELIQLIARKCCDMEGGSVPAALVSLFDGLNQVGMEFTEIRKEHGEDEYYRRASELYSRYSELVVLYFRLGAAPLHQIVAECLLEELQKEEEG